MPPRQGVYLTGGGICRTFPHHDRPRVNPSRHQILRALGAQVCRDGSRARRANGEALGGWEVSYPQGGPGDASRPSRQARLAGVCSGNPHPGAPRETLHPLHDPSPSSVRRRQRRTVRHHGCPNHRHMGYERHRVPVRQSSRKTQCLKRWSINQRRERVDQLRTSRVLSAVGRHRGPSDWRGRVPHVVRCIARRRYAICRNTQCRWLTHWHGRRSNDGPRSGLSFLGRSRLHSYGDRPPPMTRSIRSSHLATQSGTVRTSEI
jgi:hypothetical protein